MIKVLYFGTSDESVFGLQALMQDERFSVVGVVTRPPRAVGRSKDLQKSAVHLIAEESGIEVLTPEKFIHVRADIQRLNADMNVVISYGKILPQKLVDRPQFGTINVHPSLLPLHRGAIPVPATILAGDDTTGVCIMKMDEKMDHGPLYNCQRISLHGTETADALLTRLMKMGAERLPDVLDDVANGRIDPVEQHHDQATYSHQLTREDALIDWSQTLEHIERMVRAYSPWPGTYTTIKINGKPVRMKILKAHIDGDNDRVELTIKNETRVGKLVIDELQLEGKQPITGVEFAKTRKGSTISLAN